MNSRKKKAILVVSFGTSYNENREKTIGAIESAIRNQFTEYEIRRAFTSGMIIKKLAQRDEIYIDTVEQALDRLLKDGYEMVVVQPTHVMSGDEYDDMMGAARLFESKFRQMVYGRPLLSSKEDYHRVVTVLAEDTEQLNGEDTAIVLMGHGTEHEANETYERLNEYFQEAGLKNYFVGTVEAEPTLEDVMLRVKNTSMKRVVLQPLMIVAGDHASNDMAGDEEDSWYTQFLAAGYETQCIVRGMGELRGIQDIIVDHTREAIEAFQL